MARNSQKTKGVTKGGAQNNRSYRGSKAGGRGSRNMGKPDKDMEVQSTGVKDGGCNDASWYYVDPQLLKDAASLPFSYAMGAPWNQQAIEQGGRTPTVDNSPIPGLMAVRLAPSVGVSTNASSPINVAASKDYAFIRHENSGAKNYEKTDLMMYYLAMDSIYSMIAHLKRAYGLCALYSQVNRYIPDLFLMASGFEPSELQGNASDFRARLNALIRRANSFAVPAGRSYTLRHAWTFSSVYSDSEIPGKAQYYMYVPDGFWTYEGFTDKKGGMLRYAHTAGFRERSSLPNGWSNNTYMGWLNKLENMIVKMNEDEDINTMSGDILKAYGAENCLRMGYIEEGYSVLPEHNMEVLLQFHNFRTVGEFADETQNDVRQDNNTIIWNPVIQVTAPSMLQSRILDLPMANPTPEAVMVATRLMPSLSAAPDAQWESEGPTDLATIDAVFTSCGADFVTSAAMLRYSYTESGRGVQAHFLNTDVVFNALDDVEQMDVLNTIDVLSAYAKFDFHPAIYYNQSFGAPNIIHAPVIDTHNPTVIGEFVLSKCHTCALLSMFRVPYMGAWNA